MTAPALPRRPAALVAAGLVALTVAVYLPVRRHAFIGYDDIPYVTGNPMVQQGPTAESLRWAFTAFTWGNWHPLTWVSHMVDVRLFGSWAGGHHLTSLALHAANAALLFLALRRMTGALWPSAAAAALFAVHPLRVESVAWVAERKDVLSALFWMLALLAWAGYVRRPRPARYLAVAAALAAALLAKPMAVTLPFVLLLLDFWPLGRWRRPAAGAPGAPAPLLLALEKVPLLLLAGASSVVTLLAQHSGHAVRSFDQYSVGLRVANALVAYVRYLGMTVRPVDLILFHPYAPVPAWEAALAAAALLAASALAVLAARSRPFLLTGWLWYLGTLVPVIGLVQVGGQALADRYTYLPLVGVFVAASWGAAGLARRGPAARGTVAAAAAAAIAACALLTRAQLAHWRDDATMYRHILAVDPSNYLALNNLGSELLKQGREQDAGALFSQAYRNNPLLLSNLHLRTGHKLMEAGKREEAYAHYREALRYDPRSDEAMAALRAALAGRIAEIRARYRAAIAAGGAAAAEGWYREGVALGREGLSEDALASLREAVLAAPGRADVRSDLGVAYANLGRYAEAVAAFEEALRIDPKLQAAREALRTLRR
jgi:tetratricopeptide (TPR) repeat protein